MMYPLAKLGQVIAHRRESIVIDDAQTYMRCRVQSYGKGVVLRDIVSGTDIKTKQQQVCRAGEFLVAEIDAKVGGFGIVPPDLDGAVVSSHYFLFMLDETQIDQRYLAYYVRTPQFQDQVTAKGSTNYAAIRPQNVLDYLIPLPPLSEQQRIVAHIDAIAKQIAAARGLRHGAVAEAGLLWYSSLRTLRESLADVPQRRLAEITTVTAGGTPSRDNPSYWNGTIPWLKTGELLDGDIYYTEEYISEVGLQNSSAKLFPPETVLIALYGQGQTRGRTGRLMIEATTNQACCAILPTSEFDARFIQYWLRSLYLQMREITRDGAQPNWNAGMIKQVMISQIDIDEQRHIVAYLDRLQAEVDALKRLQADTAAELNALLPSLLDRAFRGEL
jgi:type I restriction enzyme S subunit